MVCHYYNIFSTCLEWMTYVLSVESKTIQQFLAKRCFWCVLYMSLLWDDIGTKDIIVQQFFAEYFVMDCLLHDSSDISTYCTIQHLVHDSSDISTYCTIQQFFAKCSSAYLLYYSIILRWIFFGIAKCFSAYLLYYSTVLRLSRTISSYCVLLPQKMWSGQSSRTVYFSVER
jgi:hypothetical protein